MDIQAMVSITQTGSAMTVSGHYCEETYGDSG